MLTISKKILCIILMVIASLQLTSCNFKIIQSNKDISFSEPQESISKFFYSIKNKDLVNAAGYLDKSDKTYNSDLKFKSETQLKMVKEVFSRTDYKIVSSCWRNNKAEILVEITAPDLFAIYNEMTLSLLKPLINKYMNGNEKDKLEAKTQGKKLVLKYVMDKLNSNSYPKTTNKVKLKLSKHSGKWVIGMNEDFVYALTGRMPGLWQ